MRRFLMAAALMFSVAAAQSGGSGTIVVNSDTARWSREQGDPPGVESVTLREDSATGAMELLARYPAGHLFAPHWHSSNERMVVLEGRMSLRNNGNEQFLDAGGYAFLPAKEVQRMACVSKTRCTFYVFWDGKLDFNPAR